jgi:hypothetical protein
MNEALESNTPGTYADKEIDKSAKFQHIETYQSLVGSLIYLSTKTRPDIAFAVHEVSSKMSQPTKNDWLKAKQILRYLKSTIEDGLIYQANSINELVGYADASFAPRRDDRKSIGGYVFMLNGAAITWKAKRQNIVALSSCEAELIALTDAVKEAMWLQKLLELFNIQQPLRIYEDNQSTIKIAENAVFSDRTKHLQVRFQFIKELIEQKRLEIVYCPTKDMTADILTKHLGRVLHQRHSEALGLQ